jgi:hypothetical protein
MSNNRVEILFPVGRYVFGNMYEPNTMDAEGKPLVTKSGADAGKPRSEYFFAVAIPKSPADQGHWANTDWGKKIWAAGHAAFPAGQAQSPAFAWKVKDGDSQIPNRRGRKMADTEGCAGHWVVYFSSGYAPKIVNNNGTQAITEKDAVKPGYYVQVFANVDGNGSPNQPGVFINHSCVALAGYGKEIFTGVNPAAVGFGQGVQLPAGASATPLGGMATPGAPMPPVAPAAAVPGAPLPGAPMVPPVMTPPVMAAPVAVQPQPAIMQPVAAPAVPVPTAMPMPVGAAPMPAARQMTAKANGFTYEQLIAAGWNDANLVAQGLMTA